MKSDGSLTEGRDIRWRTWVYCTCGGEFEVWPKLTGMPKNKVMYLFQCNTCTIKGIWPPYKSKPDRK